MNAAIISIGDELLIGQVTNTNAAYIAQKLTGIGIQIKEVATIGDDESQILEAFAKYFPNHDMTVVTGGLGPTHDDITRSAVCRFFNADLVPDHNVLAHIKDLLKKRNLPWIAAAEDQARVPRGCIVIANENGTAPGMLFERNGRNLLVLPGVPHEMESMVDNFLIPHFEKRAATVVIRQKTLKTTGIPESMLANRLGSLEELLHGAKLAFLPTNTGVRLRINVADEDAKKAEQELQKIEDRIRSKVGKYIYGVDDEELEGVIGKILTQRKLSIAVAESCTGGMIAHRVTNVPGSSIYFERGVITYSNASKTEILGVPNDFIESYGAVSKEVATAMAIGVRRIAKTDIGLSTTGVAGPTGGTPEKPVGLVWIAYADAHEAFALKFVFADERVRFKERASQAALELVRRKLLNIELPNQNSP